MAIAGARLAGVSAGATLVIDGQVLDLARLADICRRFGVVELAAFGSTARGQAQRDSDVDLLYTLAPTLSWASASTSSRTSWQRCSVARLTSCPRGPCIACSETRSCPGRARCMQRARLLLAEIADSIQRIVELPSPVQGETAASPSTVKFH